MPRARRLASGGPIREAATALFLEKGYAATTMDDIAGRAGVSKQTIYTHFPGKEELFSDLVLANAARVDDFIGLIGPTLSDPAGLEQGLRRLARRYLDFVSRPEVLRLRRLIIGESARFPELARQYYERVPGRVYEALAAAFRDALPTDQPMRAAQHFAWLTLGVTLDRGMFYPVETAVDPSDLERLARDGVRVFLAAYAR
ncbi:MAG TPA: TetR/AcrR family transcriptional regulator [Candidatus Dormibacteraeota bacterium]|nr:TetR/AcrR family transcriptional regulator [Candidatus Dormibacteraeota bacterium]